MTHLKITVCEICALVRLLNDGHKPEKISRCDVKVCNVNQYLASGSPQSHINIPAQNEAPFSHYFATIRLQYSIIQVIIRTLLA